MVLSAAPLPEEVWEGRPVSNTLPQVKNTNRVCALESAAELVRQVSNGPRRANHSTSLPVGTKVAAEDPRSAAFYTPATCERASVSRGELSEAAATADSLLNEGTTDNGET